jgi:hypothetical protein
MHRISLLENRNNYTLANKRAQNQGLASNPSRKRESYAMNYIPQMNNAYNIENKKSFSNILMHNQGPSLIQNQSEKIIRPQPLKQSKIEQQNYNYRREM